MLEKEMSHWLSNGEQFLQMFEQSPAFLALLRGPEHVFELANKAYLDLVPGDNVIGKSVREIMPELESQGYIELLDQVYTTGEAYTGYAMPVTLNQPDGSTRVIYVDFVYQPIRGKGGAVDAILVQGSDVTVRKLAEDQLKESEEKYRLLFRSIDQGYCVIKMQMEPGLPLDYQFIEINDAFEEQSGLKDVVGQWMRDLRPQHEEFWFEIYRDVVLTGKSNRFEHEARGLERWFSVYAFRIGPPEQKHVAVLFSDVTQRRLDEMELQLARDELELKVLERTAELAQSNQELELAKKAAEQANKAKSEILSNTSHELRTPLNSLLLISQLLADNPEKNLTERQLKYIDVITESGQDLLSLVNDLLDMAQIESGITFSIRKDRVDWEHLRNSVVNSFTAIAAKKKLNFTVTLAPDLPVNFITDESRLLQILKNLLMNAFKFTREGSVSLHVDLVPAADSVDSYLLGEALMAIQFTVTDTGIGISEEKLQLIFEAFRQAETGNARQYGGTGLGLTISRALAQMLGGTIAVESQLGVGSVFKLILPSEPFLVIAMPQQYGQRVLN